MFPRAVNGYMSLGDLISPSIPNVSGKYTASTREAKGPIRTSPVQFFKIVTLWRIGIANVRRSGGALYPSSSLSPRSGFLRIGFERRTGGDLRAG